jgi:hypothetical protein
MIVIVGQVEEARRLLAEALLDDEALRVNALDLLRAALDRASALYSSGVRHDALSLVAGYCGEVLARSSVVAPAGRQEAMINEARSALARAVEWSPSEQPDLRGRRVHNLVAMLLEAPDSEGPATIEQAREALDLELGLYGGATEVRAALLAQRGHVSRRLAGHALDPADKLRLLADAEARYDLADAVAEPPGSRAASLHDRALVQADRFECTHEPTALDRAIELLTEDVVRTADDESAADPQRARAQARLAALHRQRYSLARDERDLRLADQLSNAGTNSYFVPPSSALAAQMRQERALVLEHLLGAPGDRAGPREDMLRLLDSDLALTGDGPARVEIFRALTALAADIDRSQTAQDFERLHQNAAAVQKMIARFPDVAGRVRWMVELGAEEGRHASHCIFLGVPDAEAPLRQQAIALSLQSDALGLTDPALLECALSCAASLWLAASHGTDGVALNRAADTAASAVQVGVQHPEAVPAVNRFETAQLLRRVFSGLGRSIPPEVEGWELARLASAIQPSRGPSDLLSASGRMRVVAAADAIGGLSDDQDAAWVQLALSSGLDVDDGPTRAEVEADIVDRSHSATQLFLSAGATRARAIWCSDGRWGTCELPDLDDRLWRLFADAHDAHRRAGARHPVRQALDEWSRTRLVLVDAIATGLAPLGARLGGVPLVDLHLAGWPQVLPIAPVLSSLWRHRTSVAVVVPVQIARSTGALDLAAFRGVAIEGSIESQLARVVDDVEFLTQQFEVTGSSAGTIATTPADVMAGLAGARIVLIAGHASDGAGELDDAMISVGSRGVTIRDIGELDLRHIDLVVLTACETLAPDAQVPGNPLSLASVFLAVGAGASIGTPWRVDDSAASSFGRIMLNAVAQGLDSRIAYAAAMQALHPRHGFFTYLLARDYRRKSGGGAEG